MTTSYIASRKFYRFVEQHYKRELKEFRLTPAEATVLAVLYERGDRLYLKEIRQSTGLSLPSISQALAGLERKEYVSRARCRQPELCYKARSEKDDILRALARAEREIQRDIFDIIPIRAALRATA